MTLPGGAPDDPSISITNVGRSVTYSFNGVPDGATCHAGQTQSDGLVYTGPGQAWDTVIGASGTASTTLVAKAAGSTVAVASCSWAGGIGNGAKTEGIVATANSAIRTTVFPFAQITHVGCEKASVGGMIQVLCGPNDGPYTRAEKPRVIDPNCLPIPKNTFIQATPSINELRLRIWETQPDAVAKPRPPAAAQPRTAASTAQSASNFALQSSIEVHAETREEPVPAVLATRAKSGLAGELADLAELHQQGVIDDDEFRAAKLAAIKRHS